MRRIPTHVILNIAHETNIPPPIIKWRLDHGWPLEHLHQKTFPYVSDQINPKVAVYLSRAELRESREREVRMHDHGAGH